MVSNAKRWESDTTAGALVEVNVGGRMYPLVVRPDCRTCRSPHRLEIEHRLMSGTSYDAVAAWAAEQETGELPAPGANSLRSHAKGHMGVAGASWRGLIDARVRELVAEQAEAEVDGIGMARLIVKVGMEGLADGTIQPTTSDLLNAAKFLAVHDVADDDERGSVDSWREAVLKHLEIAKAFIPPHLWPDFAAALNSNTQLRALAPASAPSER